MDDDRNAVAEHFPVHFPQQNPRENREVFRFFSERRLEGRAFRITFLSSIQWEISRYFDLQPTKQFFSERNWSFGFFAPLLLASHPIFHIFFEKL